MSEEERDLIGKHAPWACCVVLLFSIVFVCCAIYSICLLIKTLV